MLFPSSPFKGLPLVPKQAPYLIAEDGHCAIVDTQRVIKGYLVIRQPQLLASLAHLAQVLRQRD